MLLNPPTAALATELLERGSPAAISSTLFHLMRVANPGWSGSAKRIHGADLCQVALESVLMVLRYRRDVLKPAVPISFATIARALEIDAIRLMVEASKDRSGSSVAYVGIRSYVREIGGLLEEGPEGDAVRALHDESCHLMKSMLNRLHERQALKQATA